MSGSFLQGVDAQDVVFVGPLSSANAAVAVMPNMEAEDIKDIGGKMFGFTYKNYSVFANRIRNSLLLSLKNDDLQIGPSDRNPRKGINSFHYVNIHTSCLSIHLLKDI